MVDKETLNRKPLHNFTPHNLGLSRNPPYRGAMTRYGFVLSIPGSADGETGSRMPFQHASWYPIAASDDQIYLALSLCAQKDWEISRRLPSEILNLVASQHPHHDCRRWPIFQAL